MSERGGCSVSVLGTVPHTQELFICNDCLRLGPCRPVCRKCAEFCHSDHEVRSCGYKYGVCACGVGSRWCHCFLMEPLEGDTDFGSGSKQCQFSMSGPNFHEMFITGCNDCNMRAGECMCIPCSKFCHHGHDITGPRASTTAYCDCGDPRCRFTCILTHSDRPAQRMYCSNCVSDDPVEQLSFMCEDCHLQVCEACKTNCHRGHNITSSRDDSEDRTISRDMFRRFKCQCHDCVDSPEKRQPAA